jgi:hypothetical protein
MTSISIEKSRASAVTRRSPGSVAPTGVLAQTRFIASKSARVSQVDGRLAAVAVAEPDGRQQASDIVEHLLGLGGDPAGHRAAFARRVPDLAGQEHEPVRLDDRAERQAAGFDPRQGRDALGHVAPPRAVWPTRVVA